MSKIWFFLSISCFLLVNLAASDRSNSDTLIDELEKGNNLPTQKYSTNQYKEILSALDQIDEKIRVVSYNMLFDIWEEKLEPINHWSNRLPRIVKLLKELNADIICTQELQENQFKQLKEQVSEEYEFYFDSTPLLGTPGRKDFDGILFRKSRFELKECFVWNLRCGTKNNPLSMVLLADKKSKKTLRIFNIHLPFAFPDAREKVLLDIIKIIKPYAETEAVILAGDMNSFSNRPSLENLIFLDGDRLQNMIEDNDLKDSLKKSLLGHFGPISTFTSLGDGSSCFAGIGIPGIILDHIFTSNKIKVIAHMHDTSKICDHFPSDHLPVVADILCK